MSLLPTPSAIEVFTAERRAPSRLARLLDWAAAARSHRVILLVMGIWLLNAFDLTLTILADQQGMLHEQNPVARGMLEEGTATIMLYKIGLILIGSYPLLRFRAIRITEMGAMVVLVAYAILAFRWQACYELYALSASGGVSLTEIESITGVSP